jgi:hypothetical protein
MLNNLNSNQERPIMVHIDNMRSRGFLTDKDKSMSGRVKKRKRGGKRKPRGAYDCLKGIFSSSIRV